MAWLTQMLPDYDEAARSLTGAWHVFLDRRDALSFFNVSYDGFWRSFAAIALVLPFYACIVLAERARLLSDSLVDDSFDGNIFLLNKALALALDWIMLPLILALVARPLGIGRTYVTYVVARNWGAVIAIAPFGLLSLLSLLGLVSEAIAGLIALIILVVVVRYSYLIARRALGVDIAFAAGLIAADFMLSIAIVGLADALMNYGLASS